MVYLILFAVMWLVCGIVTYQVLAQLKKKSITITIGGSFLVALVVSGIFGLMLKRDAAKTQVASQQTAEANQATAYRKQLFEYIIQYLQSKNATLTKREEAHTMKDGGIFGPTADFTYNIPNAFAQVSVMYTDTVHEGEVDRHIFVSQIVKIRMHLSDADLKNVRDSIATMGIVGISDPNTLSKIKTFFYDKTQNLNENSFHDGVDITVDRVHFEIMLTQQTGENEFTFMANMTIFDSAADAQQEQLDRKARIEKAKKLDEKTGN